MPRGPWEMSVPVMFRCPPEATESTNAFQEQFLGHLYEGGSSHLQNGNINVTFKGHLAEKWESFFELAFEVYGQPAISVRFTQGNLRTIPCFNEIVKDELSVQHLSLFKLWGEPRIEDQLVLGQMDFSPKAMVYACNLFNDIKWGSNEEAVKRLRRLFKTDHRLEFVFRNRPESVQFFQRVGLSLVSQRANDPVRHWYKGHIFERGEYETYVTRQTRPRPLNIQSQAVFPVNNGSHLHYFTVVWYGLLAELEMLGDEAQQDHHREAKIIKLDEKQVGVYIAIVKNLDGNTMVAPGDTLRFNFDIQGAAKWRSWEARVLSNISYTAADETALLIHRPYDVGTGNYDGSVHIETELSLTDFKSPETMRTLIQNAETKSCFIRIPVMSGDVERQMDSLTTLQRNQKKHPTNMNMQILAGAQLDNLPIIDVFSSIHSSSLPHIEATRQKAWGGEFTETQDRAYKDLRALPGGMVTINGPPGTGKTEWARQVAHTLLASRKPNLEKHKILFVAPLHGPVDDFCRSFYIKHKILRGQLRDLLRNINASEYEAFWNVDEPVVIRLHSLGTERSIVQQNANRDQKSEDQCSKVLSLETRHTLKDLDVAMIILNKVSEVSDVVKAKYNIDDVRLKDLELSAGYWCLRRAGLIRQDDGFSDRGRHYKFIKFYGIYLFSGGFQQLEDYREFETAIDELFTDTLAQADLVTTTLFNAAGKKLYKAFKPDVIIVDEAGRCSEGNILGLFAYYPTVICRILLGDECQAGPILKSTEDKNPFRNQMLLSVLKRFRLVGFHNFFFEHQHRFPSDICTVISNSFYQGRITPSMMLDNTPPAKEIRSFFARKMGKGRNNMVLIDVPTAQCVMLPNSTTKHNEVLARVGSQILFDLLDEGWKARNIGICAPYMGQVMLYQRILDFEALKKRPKLGEQVDVRTMDSFQGSQKEIMIVDATVGQDLGFMRDPARFNVGVSRQSHGLIVLANLQVMQKSEGWEALPLRRFMDQCKLRGMYVLWPPNVPIPNPHPEALVSAQEEAGASGA